MKFYEACRLRSTTGFMDQDSDQRDLLFIGHITSVLSITSFSSFDYKGWSKVLVVNFSVRGKVSYHLGIHR